MNTRVHFTKLRELVTSAAALEQRLESAEQRTQHLAFKAGEEYAARVAAEEHAARGRALQNIAHVERLSTLYSCARHAGLTTGYLNHEAVVYEAVLDAECENNGRSLAEAIWDPVFRAAVRARVDAEQL